MRRSLVLPVILGLGVAAFAQPAVPELLYYTFDEGLGATTATNLAVPGAATTNPSPLTGLTMNSYGAFGRALTGTGGFAHNLNTGWVPSLGTGSWTIALVLDVSSAPPGFAGGFQPRMYVFGEFSANQFNCCVGPGDPTMVRLRMGTLFPLANAMNNCDILGAADGNGPHHIAYVYDRAVPEIRMYLDGVQTGTVAQPALNITGTGQNAFALGAFQTTPTLANGAFIDEFRIYSRALPSSEIASTWNVSLAGAPPPFQANTPECKLEVNAIPVYAFGPATMSAPLNFPSQVRVESSTLFGGPWDLGYGIAPLRVGGSGALVTPGNQVINLDITDPAFGTWFNYGTLSPGFVNVTIPFTPTVAGALSMQMVIFDVAIPDGFRLSGPARVTMQ